jgi:hypothetical protein
MEAHVERSLRDVSAIYMTSIVSKYIILQLALIFNILKYFILLYILCVIDALLWISNALCTFRNSFFSRLFSNLQVYYTELSRVAYVYGWII